MSSLAHAYSDSATMLRRSLRHTLRYPVMMVSSLGAPIILLLLFVGVFGGALHAGLGNAARGGAYIDYVVPGILLMTVGYGCSTTALAVNKDMTEGIIARFRTMAISPMAVVTGPVAGAIIRTMISLGLVVGAALAIGFRPHAGLAAWFAAIGILALLTLALTWLAVGFGLAAKNPEGTVGFTLLVQVLPLFSSAFVPPDTMSGAVRWLAGNEPFTPVIDTLRGLLTGAPIGHSGLIAVAWCCGLALVGYLWARALFKREPAQ